MSTTFIVDTSPVFGPIHVGDECAIVSVRVGRHVPRTVADTMSPCRARVQILPDDVPYGKGTRVYAYCKGSEKDCDNTYTHLS